MNYHYLLFVIRFSLFFPPFSRKPEASRTFFLFPGLEPGLQPPAATGQVGHGEI
jgi:hypothetical protein